MSPRARVVVATYNQLPFLRRALRGYLRQTSNDFSLVVADDGSGEDVREHLRAFAREAEARGIPFEHVWHEDDGFRKTVILNEAIRRAGDEALYVFSDGDCIPPARFVERHLEAHERYSFHVGGAVRLDEAVSATVAEDDVDTGRFEQLVEAEHRRELTRLRRKSVWGVRLRRKRRPRVLGLNMAFDRALFEGLNGFDERFGGSGFEDSDIRDRAMRHVPRPAVKILYGENDVFHLWHPRRPNANALYRRHRDDPRPWRCEQGLLGPAETTPSVGGSGCV